MASGYQLVRVLIFQLFEAELAALGDPQCLGKQLGRIQLGQFLAPAQVAFTVGEQVAPGFGYRQVMADRGHAVLQGAPATGMHMHIATGHRGYAHALGQCLQLTPVRFIIRPAMQSDAQP